MLVAEFVALIAFTFVCVGVVSLVVLQLLPLLALQVITVVLLGLLPSLPFIFHTMRAGVAITTGYMKLAWLKIRRRKPCILDEHCISAIVLTSDIDVHLHMNNSRYQYQLDFVRVRFFLETNAYRVVRARKGFGLMSAVASRYRMALNLFQRYQIKTKLINWDHNSLYFEHRYVAPRGPIAEFVYFYSIVQFRIFNITPEEFVCEYLGIDEAPEMPENEELEQFKSFNKASSEQLKSKVTLQQQ